MNILHNRTIWVATALVALMALTRFHHFGSALMLPDASYAVFFLAGLYLGRNRSGWLLLSGLMLEAALIDYYAINFREVSGWCVTSAYAFLVFAYGGLWLVGRWYAQYYALTARGMGGLFAMAAVAGSLAFVIANLSFYLFAGYFETMSAIEYMDRVSRYYPSYVGIMAMYVGLAAVIQGILAAVSGHGKESRPI